MFCRSSARAPREAWSWCFDAHHRLRHRSRSRPLHPHLPRSSQPASSAESRPCPTPDRLRVRSVLRIRSHGSILELALKSYRQIPVRLPPLEIEPSVMLAERHDVYAYDATRLRSSCSLLIDGSVRWRELRASPRWRWRHEGLHIIPRRAVGLRVCSTRPGRAVRSASSVVMAPSSRFVRCRGRRHHLTYRASTQTCPVMRSWPRFASGGRGTPNSVQPREKLHLFRPF